MAAHKKPTSSKAAVKKSNVEQPIKPIHTSWFAKVKSIIKKQVTSTITRARLFLARRPHRSFRHTRRRDYVRSLKLPGYWAFTGYVGKTLWHHKNLFTGLVAAYGFLVILLTGIASQDTYTQLSEALKVAGGEIFNGQLGQIGKAGVLLGSGILGAFNEEPTEIQRVYAALLALLVLQIFKQFADGPAVPMIVAAILIGVALAWFYGYGKFLRSLTDILIPAPVIILAAFLFFSEA